VDTAQEPYKTKYDSLEGLCGRTQQHGWLSTIVSNLYVLCKIDDFEAKLDLNQYLVCCNNGVIDLQNKLFRQGKPSDMCSLSTGIDYVDYNVEESDEVIVDEIDNFFSQLFPNQSKRQYMLNHLGSVFYGNTSNQALNYYIGAGSNGKSQLVDLMGHVMGQYKGSVPLSLITAKRALVGGTSSEVIALRGVRYAVIQEPSKNDTINEGIMKELTGGDPITARGLYKEAVTFKPMFDLVVCANIFLNINSNDHGTWRRMKVVEFGSKFVDEGVCEDDYVFKKDKNLSLKFEKWKGYVLHMLIQIAFQNNGKVGDHDAVQDATERYRLSQDKVGQFIRDKIIKTDDKTIRVSKSTLSRAFKEWSEEKFKYSMKGKDLFDRLDETYISNSMVYGGFELLYEPKSNDVDAFDIDKQFIESFDLKYELTDDLKNDYIARSDIQEWAKTIKLKVCTTREISRVILEYKNIDLNDKKYCKDKKISGKGIRCVFGIKLK
jgi:P4 family phage/plasmid primase-like protien